MYGSRAITSRSVPWRPASGDVERGNSSYQAEKAARSGSTTISCSGRHGREPPRHVRLGEGGQVGVEGHVGRARRFRSPETVRPRCQAVGARVVARFARTAGGRLDQLGSDQQVHGHVLPGLDPAPEIAPPGCEPVDPGLDREPVAAQPVDRELAPPAVVVGPLHRDLDPGLIAGRSMQEDRHDHVVAVGERVGLDADAVTEDPLGRESALIDGRGDVLDDRSPPTVGRAQMRLLHNRAGFGAEVQSVRDRPGLGGPGRLEAVGHADSPGTTPPLARRADDDAIRVGRFTL